MGAESTPASPATPVPMAKTISHTLEISMPSTRTISGSRAPARITNPKDVFSMNSQRAVTIIAVMPIMNSR